jgi:hypothetical protein
MLKYIVMALALLEAGWMAFDGSRALITGHYTTRSQGPGAGQLGPWTKPISAVGLDPRSTAMKVVFVGYGGIWLAATIAFALNPRKAQGAMLIAAAGSLWYLPVGTAFSCVQLACLYLMLRRSRAYVAP